MFHFIDDIQRIQNNDDFFIDVLTGFSLMIKINNLNREDELIHKFLDILKNRGYSYIRKSRVFFEHGEVYYTIYFRKRY